MTILSQAVDPWLLAHGVLFVINYSVLMPIATFIIYYNREKFYQLHCILGIAITILLVAGWASLAGASMDKANGHVYGPMSSSSIGKSHSPTGIVARFLAVVVCIVGVVLGVLRMPKHVRNVIRIAHGVGGVLVSLFGPTVVWNGFVRLQPFIPEISFFGATPIFWYTIVIGLVLFVIVRLLMSRLIRPSSKETMDVTETEMTDIEISVPLLSIADTIELIRSEKEALFVFLGDQLIRVPKSKAEFDHPGGLGPIKDLEGKDISNIFTGLEAFNDSGRQRFHQHSAEAHRLILGFRCGRVTGPIPFIPGDTSSTYIGGTRMSLDESCGGAGAIFSIDEQGKSVGTLMNKTLLNSSDMHPVIRFTFEISDFFLVSSLSSGMKIRLSLEEDEESVERTYTVVSFDHITKKVDLVIKIYPNGQLTGRLGKLAIGEQISFSSLSCPPFPRHLQDPSLKSLLLLAAGTGIVPVMYYMERAQVDTVVLWSLRFQEDIFFVQELAHVIDQKDNVRLIVFFTQLGGEEITGESLGFAQRVEIKGGRVQLIAIENSEETGAVMSGPREFVDCMHKNLVEECGLRSDRILSLD